MSAADAAGNQVEQWVIGACRDLGVELDGAEDDLFAAGATSLTAIRLIARVEEEFGEDALPPDDLYEHSTVGAIAATIRRNTAGAADPALSAAAR